MLKEKIVRLSTGNDQDKVLAVMAINAYILDGWEIDTIYCDGVDTVNEEADLVIHLKEPKK